ncbi:MAG: FtsX-like permease family protein [Chloroflexi bacterium]|nr:MAG: FtsX-like permease family protein [Chloroflexota bacterium]
MIASPLAHKALRDVSRRKLRTLLVVIGIVVGVAGLTAINVASHELAAAFAYSASERATPDISISADQVDPSLASAVRGLPNVRVVQLMTFYSTRWKISAPPGHVNMSISAYPDFNRVAIYPFQVASGRLPGVGEIVMESSDRTLQPFKVGDAITITSKLGSTSLKVVGLSRTLGNTSAGFSSFARAYMSQAGMAAATGIETPNDIEIQVRDKRIAADTARAVTALLRARGVAVLGADLPGNQFDPSVINGLYTILDVLSAIALVLSGFLIVNTVSTLIGEQTSIIGTLKAIGATRATVMRGYFMTVAIYAVTGTLLGIALGVFGGYEFTLFLTSIVTLDLGPFQLDAGTIALSALIGLAVPFLAAIMPLWTGTRITVREAISAYGIERTVAGGGRRPAGAGWPWVPQTVWLGLRGLFRKRGRAILTLLALTFSAAAFLAIQTTTYSVNRFIGDLFSQYGADAVVERFDNNAAHSRWGIVLLTGVEQDPTLYKRDVIRGRWFRPGEQSVVLINEQLQQKSGARVGDSIALSTATRNQSWRVIGIIHDLNGGLGTSGVAMTSYDNYLAFYELPADRARGFMVGSADHAQPAVDETANRIDAALVREGLSPNVTTAHQQVTRNQGQFQILYILLYAVAAIVALVGILGLFNTLTTSVLERRREIGILRSLGATGRRVAAVFWTEALALSALAWSLAVVVGIPASLAFVNLIAAVLIPISFAFDPAALLAMLLFTFVIATVASFIPALSAARLRVVETLRYE